MAPPAPKDRPRGATGSRRLCDGRCSLGWAEPIAVGREDPQRNPRSLDRGQIVDPVESVTEAACGEPGRDLPRHPRGEVLGSVNHHTPRRGSVSRTGRLLPGTRMIGEGSQRLVDGTCRDPPTRRQKAGGDAGQSCLGAGRCKSNRCAEQRARSDVLAPAESEMGDEQLPAQRVAHPENPARPGGFPHACECCRNVERCDVVEVECAPVGWGHRAPVAPMRHEKDVVTVAVKSLDERGFVAKLEPLRARQVPVDEKDRAPLGIRRSGVPMKRTLPAVRSSVEEPVRTRQWSFSEALAWMASGPRCSLDDPTRRRRQGPPVSPVIQRGPASRELCGRRRHGNAGVVRDRSRRGRQSTAGSRSGCRPTGREPNSESSSGYSSRSSEAASDATCQILEITSATGLPRQHLNEYHALQIT